MPLPTAAELAEARKRLGLDNRPVAPAVPGFTRPEVQEPEQGGGSRLSFAADAFRSAVPQSFRDVGGAALRGVGRVISEVDKPLSDRLGLRIPEAPGPFDEIGNVALQEATRPTNALIALGGAGLAGRIAGTGIRGAGLAANLVAPAGGRTFATRALSEAVVSAGARGGAEVVNKVLPQDTPAPVRISLALAAGAAGAGVALRTTRAAVKGTIGADLLAAVPSPVRATNVQAEPGVRPGRLLQPRGAEQLGPDYTVKDALVVANDLRRQADSQANRIAALTDNAAHALGKTVRRADGNYVLPDVRDANGQPALFQEVLEFPDRFPLTPAQRSAVDDLSLVPRSVFDERATFNAPIDTADLEVGQNFIPRKARTNVAGQDVNRPKGGSAALAIRREQARKFADPAEAVRTGVVYENPLVAIDEYVRRGLDAASDAHVRDLLVPFSETSAMRVPPALRAQHDALQVTLRGLRDRLATVDRGARNAIDAYLNAADPDLDALEQQIIAAAARRATGDQLVAQIEQVRDDIRNLAPAWKSALLDAKAPSPGRTRISTERAPALSGRDFAEQDARRITRYYSKGVLPENQIGTAVKVIKAGTHNLIPLRAIGDASATLNQLAAIALSHPALFAKNFALAFRDAWNPHSYETFLRNDAQDAAAHGVVVLGRAAAPVDFQFTSWFARLPGFKQAQRHFEAITTRNRVDIYNQFVDMAQKRGQPLSALDKERVARSLNRLSGISNSRAGDVETLAEFAPNFMRSGIETIISAAADGTLEGSLARQYIRNLVFAGQAMVLTSAYLNGQDPRDVLNPVDQNALARGELRMNPNFATVRVLGQDVSVYGRFDSLARLAVTLADASVRAISTQDAKQLFDGIGFAAATKGSPLVSFGSALVTGSTFGGEDPTSPMGLIEQTAPFTVSGWVQDLRSGESVGEAGLGAAFNFFGAKARGLTPFERLDNTSQALYQKPWDALTGQEKQEIERQFPRLKEQADRQNERNAARGNASAQARVEMDEITQDRLVAESEAVQAFKIGDIDEAQFADSLEQSQFAAARERDRVLKVLNVEFDEPSRGPNQALSVWFETYRDAEIAPNVIDFDLREQLEVELYRRIEAGEFGDPAEAKRAIEERKTTAHAPGTEGYYAAKDIIAAAGYYDVRDRAMAPFVGLLANVLGRVPTGYGDVTRALNIAVRDGDVATARHLSAIQNAVDRRVQREHQIMRRQNPGLNDALITTGRASSTSKAALQALARRQ